jgi:hypothetical protein
MGAKIGENSPCKKQKIENEDKKKTIKNEKAENLRTGLTPEQEHSVPLGIAYFDPFMAPLLPGPQDKASSAVFMRRSPSPSFSREAA